MWEFEESWCSKWEEYDLQVRRLQEGQTKRFREEHADFILKAKLEMEPRAPTWSKSLLEQRRREDSLYREERFLEAAALKAQLDVMQQKEHAEWQQKRTEKIAAAEHLFLARQRLEKLSLEKKIDSGREDYEKAKDADLQRLVTRYNAIKAQIESQYEVALGESTIPKAPWEPGGALCMDEAREEVLGA